MLFSITKAAITPGTHPQQVNKNTIKIEPQPLSRTAKGGKNYTQNKIKTRHFKYFILKVHLFISLTRKN